MASKLQNILKTTGFIGAVAGAGLIANGFLYFNYEMGLVERPKELKRYYQISEELNNAGESGNVLLRREMEEISSVPGFVETKEEYRACEQSIYDNLKTFVYPGSLLLLASLIPSAFVILKRRNASIPEIGEIGY